MGAHRVKGGKRLRWRAEGDVWNLVYDGRSAARITKHLHGATLQLVRHPLLPAMPFDHWFESLATAKGVAFGVVERQIEQVIRHGNQ